MVVMVEEAAQTADPTITTHARTSIFHLQVFVDLLKETFLDD
jgi:hypothetical protein